MSNKYALAFLCFFFSVSVFASPYIPLSEKCDGYPKVPLGTSNDLCLGLLAQRSPELPLQMPRTAVETQAGEMLVVDMGGWVENKGKLWLVNYRSRPIVGKQLMSDLNLPHKILRGVDGRFYVGEAHRIIRFELVGGSIANVKTIIDSLPYRQGYLHPLKNFVFDNKNNIVVNIGSSSDRCLDQSTQCLAGEQAALWQFDYDVKSDSWSKEYKILASGLRNSMALAVHASDTLLQAENSMDFASADEPYEEINIIEPGVFYGWPNCYNRNANINENKMSCDVKNYREPWTLMPPHVAPMDAFYYQHTKIPSLAGKLLMSWHGYKIVGHRLVAFDVDDKGRPIRQETAQYFNDPLPSEEIFNTKSFSAKGGLGMVSQHSEIISRANQVNGVRPKSAFAGISVMNDGSVLIVDDKNAAILRLSNGVPYREGQLRPQASSDVKVWVAPAKVQAILVSRCSKCHDALQKNPAQLLNDQQWLIKVDGKTRMEFKLFDDKVMPMPPDNSLLPDERQQLRDWIRSLDKIN